jgi:gliding motility-associated-like protein
MEIFNRWGQKFFESNDIASSWNGTYNGSKAESGVYIYLIKFSIDYGVVKQKVGHVLLIR